MICLPREVVDYIYSFNDTIKINYKICLRELIETVRQKNYYNIVLMHLKFLKDGPIHRLSRILKPNVRFYIYINKFRSY